MRYSTYPSYKPSRVEWLGDVPSHWELKPLGYVTRFRGGATPDKSKPEYWDGDIPWVSPKDMKRPLIEDSEDHVSAEALRNSPLCMIPPGAVLIVVRGMILAHTFPVALTGGPVTINQDMKALVVSQVLQPRFLFWALSGFANALVALTDESAHGTRKLETFTLSRFPILVPLSRDQEIIADFLDRETAKLDTLVAKKRALIEKLQEKRSALISRTVTRGLPAQAAAKVGLDPHPKLKPSGIEWLGEMPEHWGIKRLRHVGDAIIGLTYEPGDVTDQDDGVLVLRASNVSQGRIVLEDNVFVRKKIPAHLITRVGDILICSRSGSRTLIGKNAKIDNESAGVTFGTFMTMFRSACNDYLFYVFNSTLFDYQSGAFLTSTINQLTVGNLYSFEVPMPPRAEQSAIADYLDRETAKIDRMVAKVEEAIERLQEYRSALITAAVTGKIDVRGAVREREASATGPDEVRVEA